jgi:hypothetical protein
MIFVIVIVMSKNVNQDFHGIIKTVNVFVNSINSVKTDGIGI